MDAGAAGRRITLGAVLATILWAFSAAEEPAKAPTAANDKPIANAAETPTREEIAGYRKWHRVNAEPVQASPATIKLCKLPYLSPSRKQTDGDPHLKKFITVYVNDLGLPAIAGQARRYPAGTTIVKEKLTEKKSDVPELLTVMTKQKPGYDPDYGDWEYLVLDGNAGRIQARGKLESCRSCHKMRTDGDHVFADSYISDNDRQRLGAVGADESLPR